MQNAVLYSSGKEANITISYTEQPSAIALQIKDEGIGIPEDCRERIFDLFFRMQGRSESEQPGLGLALSRKLARRLGVNLILLHSMGTGSTFELQLPNAKSPDQQ